MFRFRGFDIITDLYKGLEGVADTDARMSDQVENKVEEASHYS